MAAQFVPKVFFARCITHITSIGSFPSVIVQLKIDIMTVASVSDRTLWDNTIGKDFSDPFSFRSPEAPHQILCASRSFVSGCESCMTNVLIQAPGEIH